MPEIQDEGGASIRDEAGAQIVDEQISHSYSGVLALSGETSGIGLVIQRTKSGDI